jgi:hypothetical protein
MVRSTFAISSFEEFMDDVTGVEVAWLLNEILENPNSGNSVLANLVPIHRDFRELTSRPTRVALKKVSADIFFPRLPRSA